MWVADVGDRSLVAYVVHVVHMRADESVYKGLGVTKETR